MLFRSTSWSTLFPAGFPVPCRTQVPHQEVHIISLTWLSHSLTGFPKPFCYDLVFSKTSRVIPVRPYNPTYVVWALPPSLAATKGISIDFLSRVT